MGLAILILGLGMFFVPHVLTAFRGARQDTINLIGENTYKIVYSLISLIGIVLIGYGYARYRATAGWIHVWYPPDWTRHVTVALTWPAIIMFFAAYSPGRIKTALKHPQLAGIKLWA